jgi:hypothetical protein
LGTGELQIDELLELMRKDKNLHSAIMEVLYGTLIHTLRADRESRKAEIREVTPLLRRPLPGLGLRLRLRAHC